jgi:hypothetical protein
LRRYEPGVASKIAAIAAILVPVIVGRMPLINGLPAIRMTIVTLPRLRGNSFRAEHGKG